MTVWPMHTVIRYIIDTLLNTEFMIQVPVVSSITQRDEFNNSITLQSIFSRQASLARQAYLITPLHGARLNTGKNAYAKK